MPEDVRVEATPISAPFLFMSKVYLRNLKYSDKKYFGKWWIDKSLLKLTSGVLKQISDKEIDKYFQAILESKNDYHFMIVVDGKTIGHISLAKRRNSWHETQIVIGEKKYWGKGYGFKAIKLLMQKAKRLGFFRIYLEVRPNNLRAIKAYEKCGFIKTGIKKYPENEYLPEVSRMELRKYR